MAIIDDGGERISADDVALSIVRDVILGGSLQNVYDSGVDDFLKEAGIETEELTATEEKSISNKLKALLEHLIEEFQG